MRVTRKLASVATVGAAPAAVVGFAAPENAAYAPYDAKGLVAVFTANGAIDPNWTPRVYPAYPGVWTSTSTDGKPWTGGDFTGEQLNGKNNKLPYLTAYPGM
jgi:hypothetical protein